MVNQKAADNKAADNKDALWWQPAVQLFFELWGWLVVPVVAALFLGTWLDRKFNTEPILFLVVTGLAFIITMYGIIKRSLAMVRQAKVNEQKEPSQEKHD